MTINRRGTGWLGLGFALAGTCGAAETTEDILKQLRKAASDQKVTNEEGDEVIQSLKTLLDSKPPIAEALKGLELTFHLSRWLPDDVRLPLEKDALSRLQSLGVEAGAPDQDSWDNLYELFVQFGNIEPPFRRDDVLRGFAYLDQVAAKATHPRVKAMILAARVRTGVVMDRVAGGLDEKTRQSILGECKDASSDIREQVIAEGKKLPELTEGLRFELENLYVGHEAPPLAGLDLDGKPMRLADFRGKTIVLMAWATWCPDCVKAVPLEKRLVEKFKNDPVVFLGLNGDEKREVAKKFSADKALSWPSYWGRGTLQEAKVIPVDAWNIRQWPSYYVIDGKGIIRYKHCWDPEMPELEKAIRTAMESR